MPTRTLSYDEIASLIRPNEVIVAVEDAYRQFYSGSIDIPFPYHFEPSDDSIVHVKSAVRSGEKYVIKVVAYFPGNQEKGLANFQGLVMLFDGTTGVPSIIMFDNGLLTHHRTGAAGAVAARCLSREDSSVALVVGTGTQGSLQLDYLTRVRTISKVLVRGEDAENSSQYIDRAKKKHAEIQFEPAADLSAACGRADIIVTATPSRAAILEADWVKPGTHINAIGSDNPGKQELAPELLRKAIYVTDSTPQCASNGELQHAIAANVMAEDDVHAEIGAILSGATPGRTERGSITVFDSTGLGAQDLAIAACVLRRSRAE